MTEKESSQRNLASLWQMMKMSIRNIKPDPDPGVEAGESDSTYRYKYIVHYTCTHV